MRVGIALPIGERGPQKKAHPYAELREMAIATEAGGADSIWVADHLFYEDEDNGEIRGMWEALSVLAALADATTRVELGPLVMCVPFRNPGTIAWISNTIDEISGGRFVVGLGSGWHQPEFDAFNFNFARRVSLFEESLQVILPLLRDGRSNFNGEFAKGIAELRPAGPRAAKGGPPILIAGTKPRMMALVAKHADRWNSVWYGLPTDEFRGERRNLEAACSAISRDPREIEVSAGVIVSSETGQPNDDEHLYGDVNQIADGLGKWRDEGVTEIMCQMQPASVELVGRIMEAAKQVR
jgi:alkanesulfonate monooxygenase SsuD/methylene tetrahydromethanopterin reductase-like flavin-dependent oxidoreductase (luciferase family)